MITQKEVQKVAKLARLKCEGAEIIKFTDQLSKIMDMINILNEIDCTDVKPLTSVCEMSARTREDQVTSEDISDKLFDNFPSEQIELAKEVKYFIVPKVVE